MNKILHQDIIQFADNPPFLKELEGKSFLITGATGLIGSILSACLACLNQKYNLKMKIQCPVRDVEKARRILGQYFDSINFIESTLDDYISRLTHRCDYIIHCAAPTTSIFFVEHPVETYNFMIESMRTLLEYAKRFNVESVTYISSLESYGTIMDDEGWVTEDKQGYINPLEVRSSYSLGKRATECLCYLYSQEYGIPVKIARLTQTFGPGVSPSDNRVFAQFAHSVIDNKDIVLHTLGESAKPYCYTIDCISAILYILLKGQKGEAYNVANESTYISIRNMAEMLINKFNPKINLSFDIREDLGYAPVTKLKLSSKKLEGLGWKPHYDLYQMFDRYIKSLKSN